MLIYCERCVMPASKPDLHLDKDGICNACRSYELRSEVDWDASYSISSIVTDGTIKLIGIA